MRYRILLLSLLLIGGLAFLAIRAGLTAARDHEIEADRRALLAHYDRIDPSVPAGATYIIGDSIAFRAPYGPCVANRGIDGERSDQLLANLGRWNSLGRAGAVVISIGTNDVWQGRADRLGENARALVERIKAPIYFVGPVAAIGGITEANDALRRACVGNCTFIQPVGARHRDGIHLTPAGYAQIAARAPLRCQGGAA